MKKINEIITKLKKSSEAKTSCEKEGFIKKFLKFSPKECSEAKTSCNNKGIIKKIFEFIKNIIEKITSPKEFSDAKLKLIALLCMSLAVILTLPRYSYEEIIPSSWWWGSGVTKTVEVILRPDMIGLLCAIAITIPIYLRNKNYIKISLYTIMIGILDIMIISSAFSLFFGTAEWTIPIIRFTIGTRQFVLAAIFLTWICMKSVAIPIWGASFILAALRLSEVNNALGAYGVIMILCVLVSVACQIRIISKYMSAQNWFFSIKSDFYGYQPALPANGNYQAVLPSNGNSISIPNNDRVQNVEFVEKDTSMSNNNSTKNIEGTKRDTSDK